MYQSMTFSSDMTMHTNAFFPVAYALLSWELISKRFSFFFVSIVENCSLNNYEKEFNNVLLQVYHNLFLFSRGSNLKFRIFIDSWLATGTRTTWFLVFIFVFKIVYISVHLNKISIASTNIPKEPLKCTLPSLNLSHIECIWGRKRS